MTEVSKRLHRIAHELSLPEQIAEVIKEPPQPGNETAPGFVAPRSETERKVAALWGEFLGLGAVGVEDDFFALGGHSLMATQILSRVRQVFGVELPIAVLFLQAFTVAALAKQIDMAHIASAENDQAAAVLEAVGRLSDEEVEGTLRQREIK